jgi:hypothetical protein
MLVEPRLRPQRGPYRRRDSLPGAGEDQGTHLVVLADLLERPAELIQQLRVQRVGGIGPVEGEDLGVGSADTFDQHPVLRLSGTMTDRMTSPSAMARKASLTSCRPMRRLTAPPRSRRPASARATNRGKSARTWPDP